MATETDERAGVFRRLMKKVAIWEEALNYSGFDYTFDRIANVERELNSSGSIVPHVGSALYPLRGALRGAGRGTDWLKGIDSLNSLTAGAHPIRERSDQTLTRYDSDFGARSEPIGLSASARSQSTL